MAFSSVSRDYNNAINGRNEPPPAYTYNPTYNASYISNVYEEIEQSNNGYEEIAYSSSSVPSALIYSSRQPPLSAQLATRMPNLASNPTYSTSSST